MNRVELSGWGRTAPSVAEVIDLYGSTGRFDVIAITDHILMKNDLLARAGRLATLGRRAFGVFVQRPRNSGLRRSTKLRTPSRASSVVMLIS